MELRVKLVFTDWQRFGQSLYSTHPGLSLGNFHSGTTFDGTIVLSDDDVGELVEATIDGAKPVFYIDSLEGKV